MQEGSEAEVVAVAILSSGRLCILQWDAIAQGYSRKDDQSLISREKGISVSQAVPSWLEGDEIFQELVE